MAKGSFQVPVEHVVLTPNDKRRQAQAKVFEEITGVSPKTVSAGSVRIEMIDGMSQCMVRWEGMKFVDNEQAAKLLNAAKSVMKESE